MSVHRLKPMKGFKIKRKKRKRKKGRKLKMTLPDVTFDEKVIELRKQLLLDLDYFFIATSPVKSASGKNTVGMAGILPKKSI